MWIPFPWIVALDRNPASCRVRKTHPRETIGLGRVAEDLAIASIAASSSSPSLARPSVRWQRPLLKGFGYGRDWRQPANGQLLSAPGWQSGPPGGSRVQYDIKW